MAESYSVEAYLRAVGVDQFGRAFSNASGQVSGLERSTNGADISVGKLLRTIAGVAAAVGVFRTLSNAVDGAISRYDTLNTFPTVLKQMGFSAEEAEKAIDRLSDGIQGLPTTLDDVASTAQRIATMTNDLEGAVSITLALNNAFIASGSNSADASRGLNQYVQMLAKGEVDLQSWRTLQETMGVALNDTAKAFGFAGASAQNDLYAALKDGSITFADFNAKIIELDGGVNGFAERAKTSTGGIRTAWTNMNTAVVRGVTNIIKAIDEILKNTSLQSIEKIITRIGQAFFAALDNVAKSISAVIPPLINKFKEVYKAMEPIMPALQNIAKGILAIVLATAGLNTLKSIILGVRSAMLLLNSAILMNPMVWLAAVIVAAVAAFVYFWKNSESFREKVTTAFEAVKKVALEVFEKVASFIGEKIDQIKQFWDENGAQFVEAVKNAFNMILSVVEFIMPAVLFVVDIVWTAIKQVIDGALNIIMGLIKIFSGLFTGDWSKMWEGVKQLFLGAIDLIIGWFSLTFVGGLRRLLVNLGKSSLNLIKSMWTGIVNVFKSFSSLATNITTKMTTAIGKVVRSFVDAVITLFNLFKARGSSTFQAFWGVVKSIFTSMGNGIKSIWKGITHFLTNGATVIKNTVTASFKALSKAIKSTFSQIKGTIEKIWKGVMKFFKSINLYKIGKNIIQGLINGVGSMGSALWDKAKSLANGIGSSIKKALDIHSPSRVAIELMKFFGDGMVIGLDKSIRPVTNMAKNIATAVIPNIPRNAVSDQINKVKNHAFNSMSSLGEVLNRSIPALDIAGQINGINDMSQARMQNHVFSEMHVNKQPAYISIRIGNSEFNTFVDDISQAQGKKAMRKRRFSS
ncbi:phage tail protein [Cytobacillus horneckiae]|uniref:phage tail protein n=1 Tax=Cytobacillus horneckiae TaxID=549687 RepID=UPI003D9A5B92